MSEAAHLKHIKLQGFKSIAQLDLPMMDINNLIGANGVGKTNLISLFTFLSNLSQGKLKKYVKSEGGADRFFHFGTRHTTNISLGIKVGNNKYHVDFSQSVFDDSLIFEEEYCTFEMSARHFSLYPRKGESGFVSGKASDSPQVARFTKDYLDECRVYHFHDTSPQASFKKTRPLVDYHYLEKDAGNLAPFLYYLKTSESEAFRQSYLQIVSAIQTVAPFFHDFYLEPVGEEGGESVLLRWTHSNHEEPFSANVLSDGTARFICLATLFLQPTDLKPDTIILDEPELGLHPAALSILGDIIHSVAKETQVICSTQSVTFANLFQPEDFIVVDTNKKGASEFRRLEKDSLKGWLEDYEMGDIWAKNLIGGRPKW